MFRSAVILTLFIVGSVLAAEKEKKRNLIAVGVVDQCEGKDSNNYTFIQPYLENLLCTGISDNSDDYLIVVNKNGPNILNSLSIISTAFWPAGAYPIADALYFATGGNLDGKFVYIRQKYLDDRYLKICSGVLAQSLAPIKPIEVLISETLDPSTLISPTGAYSSFKKTATTICQGMGYDMQS